jgi:hypothetical protein
LTDFREAGRKVVPLESTKSLYEKYQHDDLGGGDSTGIGLCAMLEEFLADILVKYESF